MDDAPDTDAVDALLRDSAPPCTRPDTDLAAPVASVVVAALASSTARRPLRWTRRSIMIVVASTVVLTGGGLAVASIRSDAWMPWGPAILERSSTVEWQVTLPDGTLCVNRLTSYELSDDDFDSAVEVLRDPQGLIAADAGETRNAFLTEFAAPGVDMERLVDLAYGAAAAMDVDAGRGSIKESELGNFPGSVQNEVFLHSHMRLVERGLVARLAELDIDAEYMFTPETACVVIP